jgi:hypothetical protein
MIGKGGAPSEPSLGEILSRNLNDQVPVALRATFGLDERALVIFPHRMGSIVATNQRVLLERPRRPTVVYRYGQLTAAVAHLGLFYRYLVLTGPGLPEEVGVGKVVVSQNATMVEAFQKGDARRAAAEISLLIASAGRPGPAR